MTTLLHGVPNALPGERVMRVHPTIAPDVESRWRGRTNFFTGRSVSPLALDAEQAQRGGRLATSGQFLAAGIVAGLEVGLSLVDGEWVVEVAPGLGITASGEDVRLVRPIRVPINDLDVTWTREGVQDTYTLGQWLDLDSPPAPGAPVEPLALILYLEPIEVRRVGELDPEDPCGVDADDIAFVDEQLVDGVRLRVAEFPLAFDLPDLATNPGTWRNRLAYEIFNRESALGPGEVLPWEPSGVGVALLGVPSASAEPFVDIHAVARDGGQLNRRRPLAGSRGTRRLWQAQVRQFVEHVEDVGLANLVDPGLASRFEDLPPVGVLPREVLELRSSSGGAALDVRGDRGEPHLPLSQSSLFPTGWVLEAVPVELESLDDFLRASAGTEPFQLAAHEQVQVLVPVSQQHFSPDLLRVEDETPDEFRRAIRLFLLRLNHRLGRRSQVRFDEQRLQHLLFSSVPDHPFRDPDAVAGEVLSGFPDDDELPDTDPAVPEEQSFAESIEADIEAVGLDMAGTVGAVPLYFLVEQLRYEVEEDEFNPNTSAADDQAARLFLNTQGGRRGLVGFVEDLSKRLVAAGEAMDVAFSRISSNLFQLRAISSGEDVATKLAISPALPFIVQNRVTGTSEAQAGAFSGFATATEPIILPNRTKRLLSVRAVKLPGAEDVAPALVFSASVRERIASSRGLLLLNNAARAKRAAFRTLRSIHQSGLCLLGLKFPGFRVDERIPWGGGPPQVFDPAWSQPESPADDTAVYQSLPVDIDWVITFLRFFEEEGYWPHDDVEIPSDSPDSVGTADEGSILSTAFESLEHSIAALRIGEARSIGFERSLNIASTRMELELKNWDAVQRRLTELADEIDEFRHDVLVARALEQEEIARARRVNAERRQVLEEYVPFLVFRRPRTLDGLMASPTQAAESTLVPDPVPACLRADFEAPDQLRAMIDLLREAPLSWSFVGSRLLPLVNRRLALRQLGYTALHRAATPEPITYNAFARSAFVDETGQRIREIFEGQRKAIADLRPVRLQYAISYYHRFSWYGLIPELLPVVTLNDLMLAPHGRHEVSSRMSQHLSDMYRVAACLFERMRRVAPSIRLVWLELLSEAMAPVDLRELSVLPQWETIDPSEQRDMQRLVDWLYQQSSESQEAALRFVHDLVRVVILLGSYPPIHQALSATPVAVYPVVAGDSVELGLDAERVRVGMHVALFESDGPVPAVGQGVVEDVGDGVVTVRVAATESGRSVLPVRGQIIEPDRNPSVQLANGSAAAFDLVDVQ